MPENTRKQEVNKTAGTVVDVPCAECKRSTKQEIRASFDIEGQSWYDRNSIEYGAHYQVVQCLGCETTSFRSLSWNSEDYEPDPEGLSLNETINLYPSRNEGRNPAKDTYLLPHDIQRIYGETIKALNNDQPVLAGIGIRVIVESICRDKQAPGKSLVEKIDGLVTLGVLTKDGATILHKIRTLGNDAAHEVKPHGPEQLSLAVDVCENLFQGVYLLPYHAKNVFK